MNFYSLYIPMAIVLGLTFLVWVFMYVQRIGYSLKHKINAEQLYSPQQVTKLLPDSVNAASNNLKNLFEMPILFYVTILVAAQIHDYSTLSNLSAWSFAFFRIIHSAIHCLNGKVMARFIVYLLSSISLFILMGNVFWQLFSQ